MPDDPVGDKAGNTTRCSQLLAYFQENSADLDVDFISLADWKQGSVEEFRRRYPAIRCHILPVHADKKKNYLNYFFSDKLPRLIREASGPSPSLACTTPFIEEELKKIVENKKYDISLVSYAWWGPLQRVINAGHSIIDTHDFATKQHLIVHNGNPQKVGKLLDQELAILNEFDEVWSYSVEEHYIFEQFLSNSVKLMPISFAIHDRDINRPIQHQVLYVASDNPHNEKSMQWFFQEVVPLLNDVPISVIGKICRLLPEHPSIRKIGIVEDLESYYAVSKITICPMVSGTGIKIKVLESLASSLPVVTTRRGVDGLVNKTDNGCFVADDAVEFADYMQRLLNDATTYRTKRQEGIHFIQSHYSREKELKMLDAVFLA